MDCRELTDTINRVSLDLDPRAEKTFSDEGYIKCKSQQHQTRPQIASNRQSSPHKKHHQLTIVESNRIRNANRIDLYPLRAFLLPRCPVLRVQDSFSVGAMLAAPSALPLDPHYSKSSLP